MSVNHAKDSDCILDNNGVCLDCGIQHGDPCPVCGSRGYHARSCANLMQVFNCDLKTMRFTRSSE